MFRIGKKHKKVYTHSMILVLEKNGILSNTGIISSGNLEILSRKYSESGFRPVQAIHSSLCHCGKGKGEIKVVR